MQQNQKYPNAPAQAATAGFVAVTLENVEAVFPDLAMRSAAVEALNEGRTVFGNANALRIDGAR